MRFLSGWDVGIEIRKHLPERGPGSQGAAGLIDLTRPPVSRQETSGRHVRAAGLKFENCHSGFGEIEIIIPSIEIAQDDVAHDGMTAIGIL